MQGDRSFWRNVIIIGVVHVIVLGGLARWSSQATKSIPPNIVWLDGGAADLASSVATAAETPDMMPPPEPEPPPESAERDEPPAVTAVKSEIELPTPTPTPTPTSTPTATPRGSPTPRAASSATPKPSPKPAKKATPKPRPSASPKKTLLAKAERTPPKKAAAEEKKPAEAPASESATPAAAVERAAGSSDAATASAKLPGSGSGGQGSGPGGPSQIKSYSRMLHDRFYKAWVQPTSVVAAGTKMSALVKIRIEKDGRVTGFNIVRPSGNVLVDESVAAVGRRVSHVDPLPSAIGSSHYEVKMNFELTLSQ